MNTMMITTGKKSSLYVMIFLKIFFLSGFLFYVLHQIDFKSVIDVVTCSKWPYLVTALFTLWSGFYVYSFRWKNILIALQGLHLSTIDCFSQIIKGYILSQILPSSLGGDAYRILALKEYINLDKAFSVIVIDRIIGLTIFFMFSLCLAPFFINLLQHSIIGTFLALSLMTFCLIITTILMLRKKIIRIIPQFDAYYVLFYNLFQKRYFFKILFFAILCGIFFILPIYFIGLSLDIALDPRAYFLIMPIVFVSTALPISFAGWGVRESVFMLLLTIFGVEKETALALSILYGVVMLVGAIPFLPIFFLKSKTR